jgi:site-specific DNA-methyltransferase (adenine-specific)
MVAGDSTVYAYTDGYGPNWISVLSSKLYRYCLAVTRMAQHNEGARSFPALDFTRLWTDQEIYDHFQLTEEERQLVEQTMGASEDG